MRIILHNPLERLHQKHGAEVDHPCPKRKWTKKPQPVLRLGLEKESAVASPTWSKLPAASLVVMFHFVAGSAPL